MLKTVCALASGAVLAASWGIPSAHAMSAVAIGMTSDVAHDGVAIGEGHNYSTTADAEARAMQECKSRNGPVQLCHVAAHFDHQWLAVAMDPAAGTPGIGWAIADTQSSAEAQALDQCKATSPDNRKPYCEVTLSKQDTTP